MVAILKCNCYVCCHNQQAIVMKITKNFTLSEFCGDLLPQTSVIINLTSLCLNCLQPLRDGLGKPVTITSGYRTPEHNKKVGGVPNSQHLYGQAADIKVKGWNPRALLEVIHQLSIPYDQIIVYPTFIHISYDHFRFNRNQVIYKDNVRYCE